MRNVQVEMKNTKNLKILEASVEDLIIDFHDGHPKVRGVCLGEHADVFLGFAEFEYCDGNCVEANMLYRNCSDALPSFISV